MSQTIQSKRLLYNVNIPRFFMTHRLPLAMAARDAGYDVHVTTSDSDQANVQRIRATPLTYHPLPLEQHGTNLLSELQTIRATTRLYQQLQPQLVHHVSIKSILYGGIAARRAGVPAVVSAVSGLGRLFSATTVKAGLLRQLTHPFLRYALAHRNLQMIFQNPDDQATFVNLGLIQSDKTHLIRGSGVDMAVFTPQPEHEGAVMVLFAGRLMWQKGLGEFVEAARQLRGKARFVVVGFAEATSPDTVPEADLQQWAEQGIIEWWGQRDDMPDVFAQSHIVCLPSRYGEGVPKVLIEAAACGRAIVASDTAGCREIAREGINAHLAKLDDPSALVHALDDLIQHPDRRRQFGAQGRILAEQGFSLEQVIQETLAIYHQLLA